MSYVVAAMVALGTLLVLIAAVGVLRMPDLFARMQASAKAATLGVMSLSAAAALHVDSGEVALRALLIAVFLALTSPIAAHLIARAGYLTGCAEAADLLMDELKGRYDRGATLRSDPDHSSAD